MKKILSCLLIIFYVLSFTGCAKKESEEKVKVNAFEIKSATNVVDNYMSFLMKEDYENGKKLYTKELSKKNDQVKLNDVKIKGYKVTESNEVGRSGIFKVRVTRTSIVSPLCSLDEYSIKVVKDGAEYKISEINNMPQKEAFVEGVGIRYRDKKNVKTNLIIDVAGFPKYVYSRDDVAKLYKIMVPLKEFSPMNFSYEGEKLAVSTYNKNSFIGIVSIDESLAVQGDAGKSGGQSSQGGGSDIIVKEKPIGKELITLDLLFNCKVEFMTFSLDEKFLLVQYTKENMGKYIRVYTVENGDMIPVNFEKDYPIEKVQIVFSSFGEDSMTYEVIPKSNINSSETDIIGKWKLNLKDFTVDKL
ncbi:hypothetical protein LGL55_08830 [Clostridium tagluense]|uniref:hypothetical protein n=1 Tax=Clostridium tagluense TaxID=360422 RepID=UPI001CF2EF34|nr:hypothetical protein [Clostridium tagluense]MCB2311357.1 hypothetical protein [Clostridium tagluense]MCB2316001.1 hypothetical protein [Clostridium tagluense]MCB2320933.1 hypothetical protein [Clostridium tagluense]MCB2325870.1 hypothetical protein [Clostridium tagluense]MCB2330673.1 hypothetical protein [Clostridium tagluense]